MFDTAVVDNPVDETISADSAAETLTEPTVLSDLLVEDVSIDGMCGVY